MQISILECNCFILKSGTRCKPWWREVKKSRALNIAILSTQLCCSYLLHFVAATMATNYTGLKSYKCAWNFLWAPISYLCILYICDLCIVLIQSQKTCIIIYINTCFILSYFVIKTKCTSPSVPVYIYVGSLQLIRAKFC